MMRRIVYILGACAITLICLGSSPSQGLTPREGFIDVTGGRVWYRIVGTGSGTPILLLHGGPGVSSQYLKPLAALGDERPVIFYDQLGCGHSDHPTDTALWRIDRFVNEITRVRQALGLKEIHLYGHSWGTILAAEYMFTHPKGVKSVILASPALSIPRWAHDADSLRSTLPDSIQTVIMRHEKDGTTDSPEYQSAVMVYYADFLARRQPWSADIDSTFAQINPGLYGYMQGPSEFTITGTIKNYDCTAKLGGIKVPTLFTAGRYDEAVPSTVKYYQRFIPGSELAVIDSSGHLTMQDEPERYVQALRDFLHRAEKH
jgi:proline-specific peptidase